VVINEPECTHSKDQQKDDSTNKKTIKKKRNRQKTEGRERESSKYAAFETQGPSGPLREIRSTAPARRVVHGDLSKDLLGAEAKAH